MEDTNSKKDTQERKKNTFWLWMNISMVWIFLVFRLITHHVCNLSVNHKLQHHGAKANSQGC